MEVNTLLSRALLGKWEIVGLVAGCALALDWASVFLTTTVWLFYSRSATVLPVFTDCVLALLVLTPLMGIVAVVLATLSLAYVRRWMVVLSVTMLPAWAVLVYGCVSYFIALSQGS